MKMIVFLVLVCLLPVSTALDKKRLEKIRDFYQHDGIDTAAVHISYPLAPRLTRLTKREALNNLKGLPRRPRNFTVKVTLESSGHVLDLDLQRSRLQVDGALVTVMKEGGSEEFHVQDEGCHYQGFFDDNMGMASVHFCDGVLVGGAHNGHTEYHFHSHHHPLLGHSDEDDPATSAEEGELYHTIVSWRNASKDWETVLTPRDTVSLVVGEKQSQQRHRRQADSEDDNSEEEEDDEDEEEKDPNQGDQELKPPGGTIDNDRDPGYNPNNVPVAEFGVIFDEDFLRDTSNMLPTRRDLIRYLLYKYTGVQALFGNPNVTGFDMIIQIKLIYLWHKNPSYYKGSALPIGQRMGVGNQLSKRDAVYASVDVGALYTSQSPGVVEGMAFLGGACLDRAKTFVTRGKDLNWITECHEFGHTLGMNHNNPECKAYQYPWTKGFMNSFRHLFLPCVKERLVERMKLKRLSCFFSRNVETPNIPLVRLPATWPILAHGYNYHCRTYFTSEADFMFEEDSRCGSVLCAITDIASGEYGMAQITPSGAPPLFGRSCGSKGEICIERACKLPEGNTTITARDSVKGKGTWGEWSSYTSACTSACGVGVLISSRPCSHKDRPAACTVIRHRAKLCNVDACPGDTSMSEQQLRWDRKNYTCSLLKARSSRFGRYIEPYSKPVPRKEITSPLNELWGCLVSCITDSSYNGPTLQRKKFGTVLLVDGTPCGPVNVFERKILGVTKRCLRSRCVAFGCDAYTMEDGTGKVKDMCGVCGGDNSACSTGNKTVQLNKGERKPLVTLPAGTTNILFAVKNSRGNIKLALTTKEDTLVIAPGQRGRFKITDNEMNPLNFAGTHWITVDNEILTAPGPLDRPVKIKVQSTRYASSAEVLWGYTRPSQVPPPPKCENGGSSNTDIGGCICVSNTHGKQCEFRCRFDFCFNGGQKTQPKCKCKCTDTRRTDPERRCVCWEGFAGPDCKGCAIRRCYNRGSLNTLSCRCDCPDGCHGKDCSDCNYNAVMPRYAGHYGRGSLEQGVEPPVGGQSMLHGHTGFVCKTLVAVWFFTKLFGVQLL